MRTGLTSKRTGRFGLSQVTRTSALMLLAATLYGLTGVGSASAQSSYPDLDTAVPDLTKRLVSGARLAGKRVLVTPHDFFESCWTSKTMEGDR